MGPALFTRASGLPRAMAAPSQILAERRSNRQRLRRSQFVLLVRAARGSWRVQRIKRYSSRWPEHRHSCLCAQRRCSPLFLVQRVTNPLGAQAKKLCSAGVPRRNELSPLNVEFERESDILRWRCRMKMPKRLIDCLDENKASYEILRHPEADTAQTIAQAA